MDDWIIDDFEQIQKEIERAPEQGGDDDDII